MTPFFPLLYQILIANFYPLRAHFEKFNDFVAILTEICKFCLEISLLHTEWPPFLGVHTMSKKPQFFWCPHWITPFFRRNLTPNAPHFCSLVGTSRHFHIWVPPGPATVVIVVDVLPFKPKICGISTNLWFEGHRKTHVLLHSHWKTPLSLTRPDHIFFGCSCLRKTAMSEVALWHSDIRVPAPPPRLKVYKSV